jgi:hypothetical protein
MEQGLKVIFQFLDALDPIPAYGSCTMGEGFQCGKPGCECIDFFPCGRA